MPGCAMPSPRRSGSKILSLLRDRELSVGELSKLAGIPQANLSQHLALLRDRGIVNTRREGATIYYSIANPKIIRAFDLMTEVLLEGLARTEKLSKELRKGEAR